MDPWTVDVPVKLEREDVGLYLDYVESRLIRYKDHPVQVTSGVKRHRDEDRISFIFKSFQTSTGNFYTRNELRVIPAGDEYTAVLESMGNPEWVHVIGSLIRRITMDYANERN